jgi:hypothetical protein
MIRKLKPMKKLAGPFPLREMASELFLKKSF